MKNTNVCEDREMGLKEKIVREVSERLMRTTVGSLGCFVFTWYEPELTAEMIEEMIITEK